MLIFINNRKIKYSQQIDIDVYISNNYFIIFDYTNKKILYKNKLNCSTYNFNYFTCIDNSTNSLIEHHIYKDAPIKLINIHNIEIKKYYDINGWIDNILRTEVLCF